jgi:Ion channel
MHLAGMTMNLAQRLRAYPGSFLLVVLTGFILAGTSLSHLHWGRLCVDLVAIAGVLVATRIFLGKGPTYQVLATLGFAALAVRFAGWMVPAPGFDVAIAITTTLFCGGFLLAVLRSVLSLGAVTQDRIMAAVAGYVLLGLCWAWLYAAVNVAMPGAFRVLVDTQESGGGLLASAPGFPSIYYSFTTLTTMGYGDITPVTRLTQTMAWIEAGMGQIYLTVLVARLVSLHVAADGLGSRQ